MIIDINRDTIFGIKNKYFAADALRYVRIYEDFKDGIRELGMEIDEQDHETEKDYWIEVLRRKGASVRNSNKSIYINSISPACLACKTGVGSQTVFISLQCNRNCYFCSNRNQENYDYYVKNKRDYIAEINSAQARCGSLKSVGLTGGEPLLFFEDTVRFFNYVKGISPNAYTRIYTNGDFIDKSALDKLKAVSLDEIRFSIKIDDSFNYKEIYDKLALSKKYIPNVIVEMPVIPGTMDIMKDIMSELDRIGIFGMNLLEFLYPWNNAASYKGKGYKIKKNPYRVLYNYTYSGGLPISKSELQCLELLEYCMDKSMKIGVHYCSLENKLTSQVYHQNFDLKKTRTEHFSKKDYFIKTAKVYGEDKNKAISVFRKINYDGYKSNEEGNCAEFHVDKIGALDKPDMEVAIASSIVDSDGCRRFLRELKIDLTYPGIFNLETDV